MTEATNLPPIRIRALRLTGPTQTYEVSFVDEHGQPRPLSIIAGEISTGKTTILELIDYCLGAKRFPEHDEILENVRTAQLSVELREAPINVGGDDVDSFEAVRYVIERPLGPSQPKAWLFKGDFDELSDSPLQSFATDPSDPESLSQYLLRACGLGGLRVKDAPTQEDSNTSILSFRDVQPLWFLTNRRMDNADLVLEKSPPRSLKLRQVIDYFFGVSDGETSLIAAQIEELRKEVREGRSTLSGLRSFLQDSGLPDLSTVDHESDSVRVELADKRAQI